jgi:hypothetical protein
MNTLAQRAGVRTAGFLVLLGGLTFVSAGTIHFWQAWLFWPSFSVSVIAITVYLLRHDPALVRVLGRFAEFYTLRPVCP